MLRSAHPTNATPRSVKACSGPLARRDDMGLIPSGRPLGVASRGDGRTSPDLVACDTFRGAFSGSSLEELAPSKVLGERRGTLELRARLLGPAELPEELPAA